MAAWKPDDELLRRQVRSAAYNSLVRLDGSLPPRVRRRLWRAYRARVRGPVDTHMYGMAIRVPAGDLRPLWAHREPGLNRPYVALVRATAEQRSRPVAVVDVGAAVGDTALLLVARCGEAVRRITCVEGYADFVALLRHNVGQLDGIEVVEAVLSGDGGPVPGLRIGAHGGTAASTAHDHPEPSLTLDSLVGDEPVDVVKIDTDGDDGAILSGARRLLGRQHPSVLFEWSPTEHAERGHHPRLPIDVLVECGYGHFLLFGPTGGFVRSLGPEPLAGADEVVEEARSGANPVAYHDVIAWPGALPDELRARLVGSGATAPGQPPGC